MGDTIAREKIIKGIRCKLNRDCAQCPYDEDFNCLGCDVLLRDAIVLLEEDERAIKFQSDRLNDLLKAQEPVKPVPDTSYGARPWWFVCGNCKLSVNEDQKYCQNCGRAVKWE